MLKISLVIQKIKIMKGRKRMNNSFFKKTKRLLSGVIAAAMAAAMLPVIPVMAEDTAERYPYTMFAGSSEDGAITVNAGNFCVNGNVATNGSISASGNMNINGAKKEKANEEMIYIFKKLNYTYFTDRNVDVYPDDYVYKEMNININDPMDVKGNLELTGNINLSTGIKALDNVTLNGEVKNTNNSAICSETGDIIIDSQNVNLNGLVYAPFGNVEITAQNLNLNNVIIIADTITFNCPSVNANYSSSMAELVGTESDIDVELYAFGEYNEEVRSIAIEWYTNYTNSDYEVMISDDNVNYTSVATVSGAAEYQYLITEDFETRYFKISLTTNYGEVVESVPFVVTKTEDGYSVDFLDSDGDGLPDIYENMIGTDLNNPDTDGDGLTDYQEAYITGTDPTKYDSVTEGVSDADADSDGDGLSNSQEIELGTDSQYADTDDDGLSDGDEINIYNTDPLNPDTDEDGVNDGDEIVLGLNPLKPDTDDNEVLDCDEYFEQSVDKSRFDSDLFENNYAIPSSLDVSAKGNVNNNINISEYTGYLKGEERSYVGKVIEITDSEIRSGSISFTLSEDYKIKNYNVGDKLTNGLLICYNDGENTTPLATTYNEETRTLSADISTKGIYFVLDVMSWLESMGLELPTENSPYVKPMVQTYSSASSLRSAATVANVEIKGQVDIVFVIDTTGSMGSYITNVKNNITAFVNEIETAGISPSFALVDYRDITCDGQHSTNVKQNNGSNWFKKADEFKAEISKLSVSGGGDTPESAIDGLEMARQLDLRSSSQKFFVLVTDADYKVNNNYGIKSMSEMVDLLVNDDINVSVISNSYYESTYKSLYEGTGGIFADVSGNFKDKLLAIADMINEETNNGCWVALKGLIPQIVKLDENPTGLGTADTDGDSLLDKEELKSVWPTRYIDINSFLYLFGLPFDYSYPTIAEYDYYSNPVLIDTDYDGIDDNEDSDNNSTYFYGKLEMEYEDDPIISDVKYSFCLKDFFRDGSYYNTDLAIFSTLLSATIYYGDYLNIDGKPNTAFDLLKKHGFEDVKIYKIADGSNEFSIDGYHDNHLSEIYIGHKEITYQGKTKDVVSIIVRGTNGTIEEWSSNFDIGSTEELEAYKIWNNSWRTDTSCFDYTLNYFLENDINELNSFSDWKTADNHKGFDISTNRILKYVDKYTDKYVDTNKVAFWITGHSRGAAIANLLSAYLIDKGNEVFSYTFAAPNTTTNVNRSHNKYNSIFNIINSDDFVTKLPMSDWAFGKYGKVLTQSISNLHENDWYILTKLDYDYDSTVDKTINKLASISGDRNQCYSTTSYSNVHFSNENSIKNSVPKNSLPYFQYSVNGSIIDGTKEYIINEPPICYMQYLAAVMAEENGSLFVFLKQAMSLRYGEATRSLIAANFAGIKHPHYIYSYYIIAKEF